MKKVSEKTIESYLREEVKKQNGRAYKWESPGNAGVPDRIVLLPNGKTYFVELKAPGKKPTPLQITQHRKLEMLGHKVHVLDSKEAVNEFIREVSQNARLYPL
ncbi:VRR-NUC domain-containing protein [Metasolibacillus meyeri]|uniref:VRR-NUC domain-containing protein n=1 Tax=Metasolibacillus meyeri TaxID=1071052 RepID=A0AAW9NME9_9BACL|nr:VRR-NUC domain-containing protein [Metasolibacillus meyeri]MEC1177636.1 VRR-NUC domain-containing protein [Metasolibacillus meyeri]